MNDQWRNAVIQAAEAMPIDFQDYGSNRQVKAEQKFYETAVSICPELEEHPFFAKATVDEAIAFALWNIANNINLSQAIVWSPDPLVSQCQHRDDGRGVCIDCAAFL